MSLGEQPSNHRTIEPSAPWQCRIRSFIMILRASFWYADCLTSRY